MVESCMTDKETHTSKKKIFDGFRSEGISVISQNKGEPFKRTDLQNTVFRALESIETSEYPLSQWYQGVLIVLSNRYNPDRFSQAANSMREITEKLLKIHIGIKETQPNFRDIIEKISSLMRDCQNKYGEDFNSWKGETINNKMPEVMKKIKKYLEESNKPSRKERILKSLTSSDPMFDELDLNIQKERQTILIKLWTDIENITHHNWRPDEEEFNTLIKLFESIIIGLFGNVTFEDQKKILSILKLKPSERTKKEEDMMFSLIKKRGANYVLLFKNVKDSSWFPLLKRKNYFEKLPDTKSTNDGYVNVPIWRPMQYLINVCKEIPDDVVDVILKLPKTDNPTIYNGIIDIALNIEGTYSIKLLPKLEEDLLCTDRAGIRAYKYSELLVYWKQENQVGPALELLEKMLELEPDPESKRKIKKRNQILKEQKSTGCMSQLPPTLEPKSYFNEHDYYEILKEGVASLIETESYGVAKILIEVTNKAICFSTYADESRGGNDYSSTWCKNLYDIPNYYSDIKKSFVLTLISACKKVYENKLENVEDLDKLLKKPKWLVFRRIRRHLYSLHPNKQTKQWIREETLNHKYYSQWEYDFELYQMIKYSTEHFKEELLTRKELTEIFDKIISGPSKDFFKRQLEMHNEEFTEEKFLSRQACFQITQLTPFEPVLFDKYLKKFKQLKSKKPDYTAEEYYQDFQETGPFDVKYQSPKSEDDLMKFSDQELLNYINEWEDDISNVEGNTMIDINIKGLAEAFQRIFRDHISKNDKRMNFWIENKHKIKRPIYIKAMLNERQLNLDEPTDQLNQWFELCKWILSQNSEEQKEDITYSDQSKEYPDWQSSRWTVLNLVESCIKKIEKQNINFNEQVVQHIVEILQLLCAQFDENLDRKSPNDEVQDNQLDRPWDYYQAAVNTIRCRSLIELIKLARLLRKNDNETSLNILSFLENKYLNNGTKCPLTLQEYSVLGISFGQLYNIDAKWMEENKSKLFLKEQLEKWHVAFDMMIQHHSIRKKLFEVLKYEFTFAVSNITKMEKSFKAEGTIDTLGKHLFFYYLWEMYPIEGSLLENFYKKSDKRHWRNLFKSIGKTLVKYSKDINETMKKKLLEFFDWRLEVEEPRELQKFDAWLQIECLDAKWRLEQYSKVLDICKKQSINGSNISSSIKALYKMLNNHTGQVMECFKKLTDNIQDRIVWGIPVKETKVILDTGLRNSNKNILANAKQAQDNLLKAGCFEFLDLKK